MKFNYTREINNKEYQASFDTSHVWHVTKFKNEENIVVELLLHTTLAPIETYQRRPDLNKKGEITTWRDVKVTEAPTITIFKEDEIVEFLEMWDA